jgi:hypothetical protein
LPIIIAFNSSIPFISVEETRKHLYPFPDTHVAIAHQGSFVKRVYFVKTKMVSIPYASAVTRKRSIKLNVVGGLFIVINKKHDQY